ncbi:MAG: replication-relaxation family protein [Bacteriovoracales bacterium]|nr:replication-relaxation family protein [Bacteriovoracales bacterium]
MPKKRKHSSSRLFLTQRDKKIFQFLFEHRLATLKDIEERFFPAKNTRDVQKRLKKLREARLIGRDQSINLSCGFFYFLLPRGLKNLYPQGRFLEGIRLKGPNIEHDYTLIKVRKILEQARFIHRYYTENMTTSDLFFPESSDIFGDDRSFRPDAVFVTMNDKGPLFNALELEVQQKDKKRYREKIQKYYFNEKIDYVFLIFSSESIRKAVMNMEKFLYPKGNTKFLYGHLGNLLEKNFHLS